MDFFTQQEKARDQSRNLVLMYGVGVLFICVAVAGLGALVALSTQNGERGPDMGAVGAAAGFGALLAAVTIGIGTLYRLGQLRSGGAGVAEALGGRLIDPATRDADERRVLNVVEEMAIASGVPVPPVYMLRNEPRVNAFAAGYSPGDAVIGVTKGCVKGLTRDELQGVIAHEFSHILNGDMRLNIRLIGLLYGILSITIVGRVVMRYAPEVIRSKDGMPVAAGMFVIGGVLLAIGGIGAFAAHLIQAAVSRQREFLADASAVQFTRNPGGIRDALRRIGGTPLRSKLRSPRAEESAHMFFGKSTSAGSFFGPAFATHPPLPKRIRAIDPSWDGSMLEPIVTAAELDRAASPETANRPPRPQPPVDKAAALIPLLALAGNLTEAHVEYARSLIQSIPAPLREAARSTYSARAVVAVLLLSDDKEVRGAQMAVIERAEPGLARTVAQLIPPDSAIRSKHRLPLLDMSLSALSGMTPAQHDAFRTMCRGLIDADNATSPFEWVTLRVLERHLDERFGQAKKPIVQYYNLKSLEREVSVLLSSFAYGTRGESELREAFKIGADALRLPGVQLLPRQECTLRGIEEAMDRLQTAAPQRKRELLTACALVAASDKTITTAESELLRAVGDVLGVPTPPLLPGQPVA